MKLTLVRHGETEENVQGTIQGQLPGHLTEKGKRQAEETAGKLNGRHFDAIFCSDLQRCLDTAVPLRREFPDTPFYIDELLRERNGGSYTGQPLSLLDVHKKQGDWFSFRLPGGGESWDDVRARQVGFLNKLYEKYPDGSVLVVTHRGPLAGIRSYLENKSLDEINAEGILNGGISEVVMTKPVHG